MEGVNLARFVFDTRDLSTIRGGGLLLLDAVGEVERKLTGQDGVLTCGAVSGLQTLSKGASAGLFRCTPAAGQNPGDVRSAVAEYLRTHRDLQHATFVVDVLPEAATSSAFPLQLEKLIARNRWRQLQSLSLAVPETPRAALEGGPACHLDGLRAASRHLRGPDREAAGPGGGSRATFLSPATDARRKYGQAQKQRFYERITGVPGLARFASEFSEIAERTESGALHNKLAIFYADGNQFGAIQRRGGASGSHLERWDRMLREARAEFLRTFLEEELKRRKGWSTPDGRYRFETLLWGGDEMLFVLPAWKGWQFARRFFAATQEWDARNAGLPPHALTHTAALVFCHHHSPIHRIRALTKDLLAESAKELREGARSIGRERNQLVYQVLESFDHLGADLDVALATRYSGHPQATLRHLVLAGDEQAPLSERLAKTAAGLAALRQAGFPRTQLRALVQSRLRGEPAEDFSKTVEFLSRTADRDCQAHLEALAKVLGRDLPLWIHLEELWDYAAPKGETVSP